MGVWSKLSLLAPKQGPHSALSNLASPEVVTANSNVTKVRYSKAGVRLFNGLNLKHVYERHILSVP